MRKRELAAKPALFCLGFISMFTGPAPDVVSVHSEGKVFFFPPKRTDRRRQLKDSASHDFHRFSSAVMSRPVWQSFRTAREWVRVLIAPTSQRSRVCGRCGIFVEECESIFAIKGTLDGASPTKTAPSRSQVIRNNLFVLVNIFVHSCWADVGFGSSRLSWTLAWAGQSRH